MGENHIGPPNLDVGWAEIPLHSVAIEFKSQKLLVG